MNQKVFNSSMDRIAKITNQTELCESIKQLYSACFEAHKDRTTGGNFGGKTVRDQNNYDRKSDEQTKTSKETSGRYDNWKSGVKAMGISGKVGNAYDLKNDGISDTGRNSGLSKVARRNMKRKFDRDVMDFENKANLDTSDREHDFDIDEGNFDAESYYNVKDAKRRDVEQHTASAYDDMLNTTRYDYSDDNTDKDAYLADKWQEIWEDYPDEAFSLKDMQNINHSLGLDFEDEKRAELSEEFDRDVHDAFEDYYDDNLDDMKNNIVYHGYKKTASNLDDGDYSGWEDYESPLAKEEELSTAEVFRESIDRLAKITGQKELCESVKELYKACMESEDDEYAVAKAETAKLFAHDEASKSVLLDRLEGLLDNLGCAIIETSDASVDDNFPSVSVDYVYSDDAASTDSIEGSVSISAGFDGTFAYSVRDEYGQNLKDYICATQGAPLGYSRRYSSSEVNELLADIEKDIRNVTGQSA